MRIKYAHMECAVNQASEDRRRGWIEENREAMEASNDYVRKYGLPLAKYRVF